jgi:hypothetical protein
MAYPLGILGINGLYADRWYAGRDCHDPALYATRFRIKPTNRVTHHTSGSQTTVHGFGSLQERRLRLPAVDERYHSKIAPLKRRMSYASESPPASQRNLH